MSENKAMKPPKPRKRKRKKATMSAAVATRTEQHRRACFRGFLRYVERHGASLREIWDSERINDDDVSPFIRDVISWSAFSKAATGGQWRLRRDEHWIEVRRRVLEHARTEAVQAEISEINQLEAIRSVVLDRITGNAAAGILPAIPKSLEGAVGAFVQLDKRIASKRELVVEATAAAAADPNRTTTKAGEDAPVIMMNDTPLTDEEIDEMARALAEHRASLPIGDNEKEVELPSVLTKESEGDQTE